MTIREAAQAYLDAMSRDPHMPTQHYYRGMLEDALKSPEPEVAGSGTSRPDWDPYIQLDKADAVIDSLKTKVFELEAELAVRRSDVKVEVGQPSLGVAQGSGGGQSETGSGDHVIGEDQSPVGQDGVSTEEGDSH